MVAVAEAVVALELEQRSWDRPVLPLVEALVSERVARAGLPGERWLPRLGTARGNLHRSGGERIAVVQVPAEVERGLECMDDADDVPRRPDRIAGSRVALSIGCDLRNERVDVGHAVGTDRTAVEPPLVVGLQIIGELHDSPPGRRR